MGSERDEVPVHPVQSIGEIQELKQAFQSAFQEDPAFYVRVPGRVNLIGEHIDYCGYGVCPMALEQHILLGILPTEKQTLKLCNVDKAYEDFSCNINDFKISVDEGRPLWHQYFLCGVRGILDVLPSDVNVRGFKVIVSGNIPPSAGLSSSSALVSAAALATARVHDLAISKEKIANLCAECERYIGTQGGGMDQAIAFLATEGCAKLIEFSPLRSRDLTLPSGAVFVVAHSLTKLNKAATNDFNCRVVECRLAAQVIANRKGLDWTKIKKLGELQELLAFDLKTMVSLVTEILHEAPYGKDEILRELSTDAATLDQVSLTTNTTHIQRFKLHQRALHVFEEALRVQNFHETCSNAATESRTLEKLGKLMSESHRSLRDLYECSHPQLDRLVELSKELTLGARLTGAGWGGCAVALVTPENAEKYITALKEQFYKKLGAGEGTETLVFGTAPKGGACILTPN